MKTVRSNLEGTAYVAPQVLVDVDHSEFMVVTYHAILIHKE